MYERHTVIATLYFEGIEYEVELKVDARYLPHFRQTRYDPEEPECYEVDSIELGDVSEFLLSAVGDYLLGSRTDEVAARAEEEADARREEALLRRAQPGLQEAHDGIMGLGARGNAA